MRMVQAVMLAGLMVGLGAHTLPSTSVAAQEPPRFTHVALVVDDMAAMRDFYERVVGLTEARFGAFEDSRVGPPTPGVARVSGFDELLGLERVKLEAAFFRDANGNEFLELLKLPDHPAAPVGRALNRPLGLNHVGLRVDDIEAVLETMREEGLGSIVGGPIRIPEFGSPIFAMIMDPEGNIIELSEVP